MTRKIIVIGASGALGRNVVADLLSEGAQVAATYHTRKEPLETLRNAHEGLSLAALDLRAPETIDAAIDAAVKTLGGLDGLVHCAALAITPGQSPPEGSYQKMRDIEVEDWDLINQINVRSAFLCGRRASEHMLGGGNIVFLGSIDSVKPVPSPVHYAASKAALTGLARAMAKELGDRDVRVNVVAPGILEAGISEVVPEYLITQFSKHSGFGRRGTLKEASAVVSWFAAHNTYVTGQTIALDGGL